VPYSAPSFHGVGPGLTAAQVSDPGDVPAGNVGTEGTRSEEREACNSAAAMGGEAASRFMSTATLDAR
jgi:hypothetical protein